MDTTHGRPVTVEETLAGDQHPRRPQQQRRRRPEPAHRLRQNEGGGGGGVSMSDDGAMTMEMVTYNDRKQYV